MPQRMAENAMITKTNWLLVVLQVSLDGLMGEYKDLSQQIARVSSLENPRSGGQTSTGYPPSGPLVPDAWLNSCRSVFQR